MRFTRFTRLPVLAALATTLVSLTACGEQQKTDIRTYDLNNTVAAVAINSHGGTITVVAGSGPAIHVTETLRYTGAKPEPEHRLDGAELTFTSGCHGHRGNCGVDYRLQVPATVNATLDSAGGTINLDGLSGRLDLSSGGGAVDATRISAPTLTTQTGGGTSHLEFAVPPGTVDIDSAGGDATIRLPRQRYAMDVQADGGDSTVEVATDPAATNKIKMRTGGGDIRITSTISP